VDVILQSKSSVSEISRTELKIQNSTSDLLTTTRNLEKGDLLKEVDLPLKTEAKEIKLT
jgi:hypothetical protein